VKNAHDSCITVLAAALLLVPSPGLTIRAWKLLMPCASIVGSPVDSGGVDGMIQSPPLFDPPP